MTVSFSAAENEIYALVSARQLGHAADLARATIGDTTLPAEVAARVRILLANVLLMTGDPQSVTPAEAVLSLAGLSDDVYDAAEHAQLMSAVARGDFARAQELSVAVLAGSTRSQGDPAMIGALTGLAFVAWREGRVAHALGFLQAANQRSERGWQQPGRLHVGLTLALLLTTLGQFDEASAVLTAIEHETAQPGDALWSAGLPLTWARLDLAMGRLDHAHERAFRARAIAEEMGAGPLIPMSAWMLASIALYRGRIEAAAQHLDAYRAAVHFIADSVSAMSYVVTEAEVAEAQHDANRAREVLAPVYANLPAHRELLVVAPMIAPTLTRRAAGRGNRHDATNVVAEAEMLATASPDLASLGASAMHARGLLARDRSLLEHAEAAHLYPWARASAAEDLGALLGQDDGPQYRTVLERAEAAYLAVGATRDAERVHTRLSEVPPRRWHRVGEAPGDTSWSSLTDTERRIAVLVSEGLTNAQIGARMFMSRHTVDAHLRHVFRKLGVNSRVELTRRVIELEG